MPPTPLPGSRRSTGGAGVFWLAVLLLALLGVRSLAGYVIELAWWKEIGQESTYWRMITFGLLPVAATALVAFVVFWAAHARGLKAAGTSLRDHPGYARWTTLALLGLGIVFALLAVDGWTVVRYLGGYGLSAGNYQDPVFGKRLPFYLFDLPFYHLVLRLLLGFAAITSLLYWLTHRSWQLGRRVQRDRTHFALDVRDLSLITQSRALRYLLALLLVGLAVRAYLERYAMTLGTHPFLTGIDYVDEHVGLPLQWLLIAAYLLGAVAMATGRFRWLAVVVVALLLRGLVPAAVNGFYVRPNEISLQRPYLQRHIAATRAAYGLDQRLQEAEFPARGDASIDVNKHRLLLENVRLWDWRAFHDTITQIQALRPYYSFHDSDVDRYRIQGQLRQVLLSPRELDVRQLPDARTRWINPHFIYTHGYGMVMAESSRISADGLPVLVIENAPTTVNTPDLKLTRPELYYGEVTHEPVFVRTGQAEFNYPAGADNVHTRYEGKGGFPISSLLLRTAAALSEGEWNILLTGYLQPESRMMIRRNVRERLQNAAGFLHWDEDPYLVLTRAGRMVWMVDGYTTSDQHPYSHPIETSAWGEINYARNAVKATVDAYDGDLRLYNFDPADPIIQAWQRIFPNLIQPASAMPEDLREHARYPETLLNAQAEIYRTYHMRDSDSFYNREDLWDVARTKGGQNARPQAVSATYVIATLPGETQPEFLLLLPFTPRGKDNLIGVMAARCDGPHLGQLKVIQLSKQALIFGPMQIEARIDQDQNISKDLSLWNQQGSQVLRGQMLALPLDDSFLYIEPIYIQASEARMPQLKKVVLATGNRLVYTDTYEQALTALSGTGAASPSSGNRTNTAADASREIPLPPDSSVRLEAIRMHMRRYRELSAQGQWAEAGRELEAINRLLTPASEKAQ